MLETRISNRLRYGKKGRRINLDKLGQALRHCYDLTFLQNSDLTLLPSVVRRCQGERTSLDLAKALRKELVAAAMCISRRTAHFPIRKILKAIEEQRLGLDNQRVVEIQRCLGIPFSRDRIDLARYYAIRLVMEGVDQQTIADRFGNDGHFVYPRWLFAAEQFVDAFGHIDSRCVSQVDHLADPLDALLLGGLTTAGSRHAWRSPWRPGRGSILCL